MSVATCAKVGKFHIHTVSVSISTVHYLKTTFKTYNSE